MNKPLTATPEQEDFGKKFKETNFITQKLLDNYFKSVKKLINKIENEDIQKGLEVGCGEGFSTIELRELLNKSIELEASEYVDDLVPVAQERNPEVKVIQENIYELERKDNSMDLVFLLEVLEHLDYPEDALKELKRVSSKYLILGVPREPIWRILNFVRGKYVKDFGNTTGHLNHWSSNGIIKLVEKHFGPVIAVEKPLPWTIVLAKKDV